MKILVVDDDPIALELLKTCLHEASFFDLTFATSAMEAEQLIHDTSQVYDCFLLDISMPKKNGIELCSDIRRIDRYLTTPVLMVTRLNNSASIEKAFSKGANDYITKPFEFFEVITRIKVAHRLVTERKAAIESYHAANTALKNHTRIEPSETRRKIKSAIGKTTFTIENKHLLPISTFENYVVRLTCAEDCRVDVVGVKIENISHLFSTLRPAEFNVIIGMFIEAAREYAADRQVFMSHIGDGTFIFAADHVDFGDPDMIEQSIWESMKQAQAVSKQIEDCDVEFSVGVPVRLERISRPNFSRLIKVLQARIDARIDGKTNELSIAS